MWRHYVNKSDATHIAIKAHSAGGGVVSEIMKNFPDDFKRRVFANAFTGVNVSSYSRSLVSYAKKVSKLLTNCYFFGSFQTAIVKKSIGYVDPSLVISSLHTS